MSLSTTRGFGAVLALAATFLWLFVLWYAIVQPAATATGAFRQAPSLDFWRFQATFLAIVGFTTITVVLLRIFTRIRLTPKANLEWSSSCRWGLLDLMALSFGIAMVVAATNLRGDILTIILSAIVAVTYTLCVALFWCGLSLPGPWRWAVSFLLLPLQAYLGAIALNAVAPRMWGSYSWRSLLTNLPTLSENDGIAVIFFFMLMILPPLASMIMGQRLVGFPSDHPVGVLRRALVTLAIGLLTLASVAGTFFAALAPWQRAATVRTAGWPFYYTEVSERLATAGSPSPRLITHVALHSNLRLAANIVVALAPLILITIWWFYRRRKHDAESRTSAWILPGVAFSWFFVVYFCPSLLVQYLANRATSGRMAPAVSALTQDFSGKIAKRNRNWVAFPIGDAVEFERVFSTPGGCRLTAIALSDLKLTQNQLDRLAANHALISLDLTRCQLVGNLNAFIGHPHLERLTLKDTELDSEAQAVLDKCPSFLTLNLSQPLSAWKNWPKTVESIWISCDENTPTKWTFSNLPRLIQFTMVDSSSWESAEQNEQPKQQPVRELTMIRCGAPQMTIGNTLPVHLRIKETQLESLWGTPSYSTGTDELVAHYCDLRSFECDELSKLTMFQACLVDCQSFVLKNPSAKLAGASVALQGVRLPTELRLDFDPAHPEQFTPMGRRQSARFLAPIIGTLQPVGLTVTGMTVTTEQLRRLANVANPGQLEIQGNLLGDNPLKVIGSMRNLNDLKLVGIAPTDPELSSLLTSLPKLEILALEGRNLRSLNLSKAPLLADLSLLTGPIPTFRIADLRRLNSLVLGSEFAENQYMTDALFVTDSEVPTDPSGELARHT